MSVAVALACGAGASLAADATLKITSFTVSAAEFSNSFASSLSPFQSYNLSAIQAGGAPVTDTFSANNWNLGLNRVAQTANAKATGNTVRFTVADTQLLTPGFNLAAQATGTLALPNSANVNASQSGSFFLLNDAGACTGGTIMFDIFYEMSVATPGSSPTNFSQTALSLVASGGGVNTSFADGLLSTTLSGGTAAL